MTALLFAVALALAEPCPADMAVRLDRCALAADALTSCRAELALVPAARAEAQANADRLADDVLRLTTQRDRARRQRTTLGAVALGLGAVLVVAVVVD